MTPELRNIVFTALLAFLTLAGVITVATVFPELAGTIGMVTVVAFIASLVQPRLTQSSGGKS